jgi:hypothetical protein
MLVQTFTVFIFFVILAVEVQAFVHQPHASRGLRTSRRGRSEPNYTPSIFSLLNSPVSDPSFPGPNHQQLGNFLSQAKSLGAVRFVVVGSGAILEAVGSFDNLRYADTPKGRLATVSLEEPCFECHIKLAEVKSIKNVVVEKFGKQLRITRFLGADGGSLLSAILHLDKNSTESAHSKQIEAW